MDADEHHEERLSLQDVHSSVTNRSDIWIEFQDESGIFGGKMRHSSKYEEDVSFIAFRKEAIDETSDTFFFLRNSAEDFLVKAYELVEHPTDHVSIMTESVIQAHQFFKRRHERLGPPFMKFFRNLMQGFIILTKKEMSIGDFKSRVFVTKEKNEGRILPSPSQKQDLKNDLILFRDFLVELVDMESFKAAPPFLKCYLHDLEFEISMAARRSCSSMFVQLVVDCPSFWSSSERVNFINNLYLLVKSNCWNQYKFRGILNSRTTRYQWIRHWQKRIEDTVFIHVFNYPAKARRVAKAKPGANTKLLPGFYNSDGYDLMRYVVALYHHYNDHISNPHKFLKPTEIEEKVYNIFPELYYTFTLAARVLVRQINITDNSWNILQSVGEREFKLCEKKK